MLKLIVVILIIGVLAAFAIPRFFDVTEEKEKPAYKPMAAAATCKSNRGAIQSACNLYYSELAIIGKKPVYPEDYKHPELYRNNEIPACPDGGEYHYDPVRGKVTCMIHKDDQ